jgi:hypothetical protein
MNRREETRPEGPPVEGLLLNPGRAEGFRSSIRRGLR